MSSLPYFSTDPQSVLCSVIEAHFRHNGERPSEIRLQPRDWVIAWRSLPDHARFAVSDIRILGVPVTPDREVSHGTLQVISKNDSVDVQTGLM